MMVGLLRPASAASRSALVLTSIWVAPAKVLARGEAAVHETLRAVVGAGVGAGGGGAVMMEFVRGVSRAAVMKAKGGP